MRWKGFVVCVVLAWLVLLESTTTITIAASSANTTTSSRPTVVNVAAKLSSQTIIFLHTFNGKRRQVIPFSTIAQVSELSDFASVECDNGETVFERYSDAVSPQKLQNRPNGYILPCLYPHNKLDIAQFVSSYCDMPIQRERRHLLVLLVLGSRLHAPTRCKFQFKLPREQFAWPIVRLYNSTGHHLVGGRALDAIDSTPLVGKSHSVQDPPTRSIFLDARVWNKHATGADNSGEHHHEDAAVTSFLQVSAFAKILGGAMDAVIRPLMKEALGRVCRDIQHRMTQEVTDAAMERVPEQVIELITVPMKYNITNGVLDAGAFRIIDTLTKSFTNELGPTIADKIKTFLPPQLHEQISPVLHHAVADDVQHMLPQLLKRAIKLVMTPKLMRTCTHSIVAAVDMALGHTADPEENAYCRRCYNDGNSCMKCKTSRSYKYYQHYYTTYYSEYFTEYYLQYYSDALLILDQFYNPDGFVSITPAEFGKKA